MEALVTGGCGFIGSHLVDRLIGDGHRVHVIDNLSTGKRSNLPPSAQLTVSDVADETITMPLVAQADIVFHLAATASVQVCEQQPELAERTNIHGAQVIFRAAAAHGKPVVYASSAAVYGDNPALPLSEDATPQPLGAYGRHKLQNERDAVKAGPATIGLRFFNVYGPRQDAASPYSGVISKFMANARAGLPLTFFGDGEQTRDFIYVADIVALLLAAASKAQGHAIYNGCTGRATSLKQLAAAILTASNSSSSMQYDAARSGDIRHSLGSPAGAQQALGFTATTALADGLAQLYASEAAHAA